MTDSSDPKGEESEEFKTFKAAMMQIVRVKKLDIVEDLPKMFRERKPPKKAAAKSKRKGQKPKDE